MAKPISDYVKMLRMIDQQKIDKDRYGVMVILADWLEERGNNEHLGWRQIVEMKFKPFSVRWPHDFIVDAIFSSPYYVVSHDSRYLLHTDTGESLIDYVYRTHRHVSYKRAEIDEPAYRHMSSVTNWHLAGTEFPNRLYAERCVATAYKRQFLANDKWLRQHPIVPKLFTPDSPLKTNT